MTRLTPSFSRATTTLVLWFSLVAISGYFWQGYFQNHWWSRDYILSLGIPLVLMIAFTWVAFVPRKLEYSDQEFLIHSLFFGRQTFTWSDLSYYGSGNNVFLIQFESKQAFQIFVQAYPKKEWLDFTSFLQMQFPDKKASGWIGPRGFKWK